MHERGVESSYAAQFGVLGMARKGKPIYIPLYYESFIADNRVQLMTTEQVGAYVFLMFAAWQEKPPASLPDDDAKLAGWSKLSITKWKKIGPQILECWRLEDGRWYHDRLADEHAKSVFKMEKAAFAGKKGADARWQPHAVAIATASQPQCDGNGIQSQSQSQSQIQNTKDKEPPTPRQRGKVELSYEIPERLNVGDFPAKFSQWIEYRKAIKKPLAQQTCDTQLKTFVKWGPARAIAAIEHTIGKGWQGLVEPDNSTYSKPQGPTFGAKPITQLVTRYGERE